MLGLQASRVWVCTGLRLNPAQSRQRCAAKVHPLVDHGVCLPAGVQGLQTEWNKKTLTYALLVADTVVAQGGGAKPEVLTSQAPKGWSDVAYYFKVGRCSRSGKL